MCNLGARGFRSTATVGANANNDHYQPECAGGHDKEHNGKNQ